MKKLFSQKTGKYFEASSITDFLENKGAVSADPGKLVSIVVRVPVQYNVLDVGEDGTQFVQLTNANNTSEFMYAYVWKELMREEFIKQGLPKDGLYTEFTLRYSNKYKRPYLVHILRVS